MKVIEYILRDIYNIIVRSKFTDEHGGKTNRVILR